MKACAEMNERFDRIFAVGIANTGKPLTCCKGCSACCYEPVFTIREEAQHAIEAIPAVELEGVKKRTQRWFEKAEKTGVLGDGSLNYATGKVITYREARMACPFLKDNSCMVYENRPIACRGHATQGPRKFCEKDRLRLRQKFTFCPEALEQALQDSLAISGPKGEFEEGHMALFLVEELLGIKLGRTNRELDVSKMDLKTGVAAGIGSLAASNLGEVGQIVRKVVDKGALR